MDKIREMTSFVAVVDAGSFVGAADATGASKAAISRHIAELEQRLDVRLLNRTTRRLSLTDDGQRLYSRAKELLASLDEFESEMTSRTGEPSGLLRINAPLTFGVLHLAPLWGRFSALHPKVALDVTLNDRMVDLVDEGFDLAIRITSMPSSQLVSRKLASTRIVLCASPAYLEAHGTPTHPRELARHRVIGYSYWSGRDEWSFSGPEGNVRVHTTPWMRTNNGDTCRAAALEGQGIILQPDFLIGRDLKRGDLVELMPDCHSLETGIHAVWPTHKYLPMKLRRLIDFLVAEFEAPVWTRG